MTGVLFAGQEDISFLTTNGGSIRSTLTTNSWAVDTSAGRFRPTYPRYALSFQTSNATVNAALYNAQLFTSNNFWTTGRIVSTTGGTSTTTSTLVAMQWGDGRGVRLRIRFNGTGTVPQSFFVVEKLDVNGVATSLGTSTLAFAAAPANAGFVEKIDVYINYAVSGTFTVYCNGVQTFTYSGDVTTNSVTNLNTAYWGNINVSNSTSTTSWSEMIVSTKDTRNLSLLTQVPTSFASQNGDANTTAFAWFGNFINYQKVIAGFTGTLTNALINISSNSSGTYKFGVYSDSSGAPNSLLGSGSVVNPSTGLNTVAMSGSAAITAGTTYWVAMINNSGGSTFLKSSGNTTIGQPTSRSESIAFASALPATATSVVYATGFETNIWMGFTVSISANNWTSASVTNTTTNALGSTPDTSNTTGQIQKAPITPAVVSGTINKASTATSQFVSNKFFVRGVVHHATAGIGATGLQNIQFIIDISGVTYTSSTIQIGTGKNLISYIWDNNPATSAEWSTNDLALYSSTFVTGYKSIT